MESQCGEVAHRVLFTCGDYEILGSVMLQYEPHALHIIPGVSPVAERREIAEIQLVLQAVGYACCGESNLSGDESLAATLALVIEEDTRAAEHVVGLAIFLHYPVAVELGNGIRAIGMEGGVLVLRHLLHLAVKL